MSRSEGLLGGALLLVAQPQPGMARLSAQLQATEISEQPLPGKLACLAAGNAMLPMLPMLPLFEALAVRARAAGLLAGPGTTLRMEIAYD